MDKKALEMFEYAEKALRPKYVEIEKLDMACDMFKNVLFNLGHTMEQSEYWADVIRKKITYK